MTPPLHYRPLEAGDLEPLVQYLYHLQPETRRRFGPHPFDREGLLQFYSGHPVEAYIALNGEQIIAYTVVYRGLLPHDRRRISGYGYPLAEPFCYTLAPSVADAWQGKGVGPALFDYVRKALQAKGCRQLWLWGGVQSDNLPARRFYARLGFIPLGTFNYQGLNEDQVLECSPSEQ